MALQPAFDMSISGSVHVKLSVDRHCCAHFSLPLRCCSGSSASWCVFSCTGWELHKRVVSHSGFTPRPATSTLGHVGNFFNPFSSNMKAHAFLVAQMLSLTAHGSRKCCINVQHAARGKRHAFDPAQQTVDCKGWRHQGAHSKHCCLPRTDWADPSSISSSRRKAFQYNPPRSF